MWTYLLILFSAIVLVIVYGRRAHLLNKKRKEAKDLAESPEEKSVDEEIEELASKASEKKSKKDMETVGALCKKGEEKLKAGKEDEAIKFFVQALAIDELHLETQNKLAMLYMKKQLYSSAAALFRNLGKLTGEALHYSHLGVALFHEQDFEGAREAYQKALEIDPSRPQRYVSLAQVYRSLGQLQNAVIALNKAVESDDQNLDYIFLLGEIQAEMGNKDEAMEIFKKLKELNPDSKEVKEAIKGLKSLDRADSN